MSKGRVLLVDSSTGRFVKVLSPQLLTAWGVQDEFQEIAKAAGDPKSVGSKRLRDRYGTTLDGAMCATRPFDLYLYAYAVTLNTYHARAIRAKVKDIAGGEWKISGDAEVVRKEIQGFFENAFGELTFDEGLSNIWTDYEALGNGYMEVIQTTDGKSVAELNHLPATETWIRLDGLGFVQQKNGEYSHFRRWGIAPEKYADLAKNDPLASPDTTSMIHLSRYFPWSPFYGIPSIMPGWNALSLAVLQAEYNLSFFQNNAVPDYAVILEGEWADGAEATIQEYFRTHLKGQSHKTMVLSVPNGGKATFETLTSGQAKEAAFRLLRADCRDEVLHCHGVPPQKVGIVETGKMGGNLASEQIAEYKNSIVAPGRGKIRARLNRLINASWPASGCTFDWTPYDTEDIKANAEVDRIYIDGQVLVPNEVRHIRYPSLPPLPGGDVPKAPSGAAAADSEQAVSDLQRDVRSALRKLVGA